ncbi:lysophospholipid acyltransferase family protein [Croceicoccus naphthovorans]|nr:lysophospholipid acyltransferase family protein [Croceicoccus naphthovorans]MBB3989138.1 1-acyl-sn-glycerol-3-phosphate acyltransferase [Croceicoccus naphthovorans]
MALRTALFGIAFYGGSFWLLLLTLPALFLPVGAMKWVARTWSAWHRFCVRRILGIRVVIDGAPRPAGPALYATKHESFFEAIDAPTFLNGPVVPFAKMELMHIPLWGRAAAHYGVIGVDRESGAKTLRAMARQARSAKSAGRDFILFPEGTRVPHGEAGKLQSGLYGIYKTTGLPLVPVAVDSGLTYGQSPKRPGTIRYLVGEAIPPGLPRAELEDRVLRAINALNPASET